MPCLLDVYKANISNMMKDKSAAAKKQLEEVLAAIEGIKTTMTQEVHNQTADTPGDLKSFDKELELRLQNVLQKLYPEVNLNYTDNTSTKQMETKGEANITASTVLINSLLQSQDTLPHEYAHHYIAWFRDAPVVQEAIKKWGSEEALVQAIGEQVVKQKGEAYSWWKKFTQWLQSKFDGFDKLEKEEIKNILTDAFLQRYNLKALNTRSNANFELKELFLDTVKEQYRKAEVEITFDEFLAYAQTIFKKSTLQDIYKHATNIKYDEGRPSKTELLIESTKNPDSIPKELQSIGHKYKEQLDDVLKKYKALKATIGVQNKPNSDIGSDGIILTRHLRGISKDTILNSLNGYSTGPGYIEYVDTRTGNTHILDISELSASNKSYAERKELSKKLAQNLEGDYIIIKQVQKGDMLSTNDVYYIANDNNEYVRSKSAAISKLAKEPQSKEDTGIDHYFTASLIDAMLLVKGSNFVNSQNDMIEFLIDQIKTNPLMYDVLMDLSYSIPTAKELYDNIEKEIKPFMYGLLNAVQEKRNDGKKWMYKEGFDPKRVGQNASESGKGYYFAPVGQTKWGDKNNTEFLVKLDVSPNSDSGIWSIPNITEVFRERNEQYPQEAVVRDTKQIHIFGSDKDIQEFKKWKDTIGQKSSTSKDDKKADSKKDTGTILESELPLYEQLLEKALECK